MSAETIHMDPAVYGTPEPDVVALGDALRALRERRGLSQNAVAVKTGVPQTTMLRLEKGVMVRPTMDDMAVLARFYGIDLNAIGALMGIWETDEQTRQAEAALALEARSELAALRRQLRGLPLPEQRGLAGAIKVARTIWERGMRGEDKLLAQRDVSQPDPRLPTWLTIRTANGSSRR